MTWKEFMGLGMIQRRSQGERGTEELESLVGKGGEEQKLHREEARG